jgi:hypothetical protein
MHGTEKLLQFSAGNVFDEEGSDIGEVLSTTFFLAMSASVR